MSQPGETTNFRASDHVTAIHANCGIPLIDVCVVNTQPVAGRALVRYRANAARPVENDLANLRLMGLKVVGTDLLRMSGTQSREKIRHDPSVIAAIAIELAQKSRRDKMRQNRRKTTAHGQRPKRKLTS